jgi:hypothetical protein
MQIVYLQMFKLYSIIVILLLSAFCHAQDNVRVDNTKPKYKGGPMDSAHIKAAKKLQQARLNKFYTTKRYGYLFRFKHKKPMGRKNGL